MIPSPLSLDSHFFTKIEIIASDIDPNEAGEGVMQHRLDCKRHKDHPRKFMINFGLRQVADKKKGTPTYTFEFEAVGFVTVIDQYPEDKIETLVRVNGAAILYGAIREMVANLTARGPFKAINLPTVTFVDEVKDKGSKRRTRSAIEAKA